MQYFTSKPKQDGFYMPAEFEPHAATIMIFPEREGSWREQGKAAAPIFARMIEAIAKDELVYVLCNAGVRVRAEQYLSKVSNVRILDIPQDDAWARDTAPTFVRDCNGNVRGIDWNFNAWGGAYDGLYSDYAQDNALAFRFCEALDIPCYNAHHFVLEGGAIHSDGEGTILVTESCLLSKGRNPQMSKEEIAEMLCEYLGGEKVLWLPRGIWNDETNEHVDNVCCFIRPGEVVLAWTDSESDPQYALSKACLEYLKTATDAKGRKLIVHKLPIPKKPVCVTEEVLKGLTFAEGEDIREVGERLAASYVNFYFTNHCILLPQFGGENTSSDAYAVELLQKLCPERTVVPIPALELIQGGGNIHCLTQQIPKGVCL